MKNMKKSSFLGMLLCIAIVFSCIMTFSLIMPNAILGWRIMPLLGHLPNLLFLLFYFKKRFSTSVAAIGVAAHECGHAIQHQVGYVPIKVRIGIVPFVNICNYASIPLIMIGLLLGSRGYNLAMLGVILFSAVLVFQIVTLPTETNASKRALMTLQGMYMLQQ